MKFKHSGIGISIILLLITCNSPTEPEESIDAAYLSEVEQWKGERKEALKKPDSWLSLAGLFFLKEGPNSFGSDSTNTLVFPEKAPGQLGVIWLEAGMLRLEAKDEVEMFLNDSIVQESTLSIHSTELPSLMRWHSLSWYILERDGRYLIRLKDAEHRNFEQFTSIDHFPIDQRWKIKAKFIPHSQEVAIRNVLDMNIKQESAGRLQFEVDGQKQELMVLDGGKKDYFIIFADQTTGEETYGGGRYLYTPKADSTGFTYLDFNKAYNPPCVFTPYATCLLPPPQNRLAITITAGEKNYGDH